MYWKLTTTFKKTFRKKSKTVIMAPKRKHSKLWNYFEELNPSLIKCTYCKKKIKTPTGRTKIMRAHILNVHGISLDYDTLSLPDDLEQYYSELSGYKAKCKDCGKTISFLSSMANLRKHLRRHSTRIQSQDETVIMAPTRKRSKLWNHFEELNPSLVKCTTCKKEIKTPNPTRRTKIMRTHILNVHGISLDDETVTLPDDLKQYYSELPGYKAKCYNCGKAVSFLTNIENLRVHLRRHSIIPTRIQSQNDLYYRTLIVDPKRKRSKLWNYFEVLKPSLVKCKKCKKHFYVPNKQNLMKFFRGHLFNVHRIYLDGIHTLPDDLRQCYSELPGYKAKCNNCGKTMSFLTAKAWLREHLRRHSIIPTRIQSRDETVIMAPTRKRSKLWNHFEELNPSLVKCTTCKKEIKTTNPARRTIIMRAHILNVHGISLDDETVTLPDDLKQYYSKLPRYKAKCNNCGKTLSFLTKFAHLRKHLRRHSTSIQSPDKTVIMASKRKRSKLWNYFEELNPSLVKCTTCKKEIKIPHRTKFMSIFRVHLVNVHGISLDDDTVTLPDDLRQCYSKLPGCKAKCNNCGETVSSLTNVGNLRKHLRRHSTITQSRDEMDIVDPKRKRSKIWNYFEKLKPLLVKCTTCKREIKLSDTKSMRLHLSRHGIFLDNDTLSLPDDLRQYYSVLPKYKAKCNNCGETVSFLTDFRNLRRHLRRHSTSIQSPDETTLTKKRSKFWNYFEELKPTLVKCTTCKKEIKIPDPTRRTKIMRIHLSRHGIFLDNDSHTLPYDLKQNYSELPGYKAKCNNCGKTLSFLSDSRYLREHLRRHSIRIQNRNKTIIVQRKKRSKLWNYFEELKPSLVKCVICKIEIYMPHPSNSTAITIGHLNRHGIFFNNDTFTLPDDLRQYYSELPRYKAKCNDCGKTISFLTNIARLRKHLRRHSTRILSRDETVIMATKRKRSRLWNYFEKLNPSLVKCTTCKKEIKTPNSTRRTKIMRAHILNVHGISLDDETVTLPDDLKQYYSELPEYKAKCNNCGKAVSFLTNIENLRVHLRRHSINLTGIQSRNETTPRKKRSKLWNYFKELKPTLVKCTICKKEIKISRPSNRITIFRVHLKRHGIFLDNDTHTLPYDLKQYYSKLPGYKAKCNNCGKIVSFLTCFGNLRRHLRRHSTRIQSGDELSTSSLPGNDIDPNVERQDQETIDLTLQSCEQSRKETRACDESSTSSLTDYMDPTAKRQSGELSGLPVQSFRKTIERTGALNKPGTSISTGYNTNLTAECQSQETVDLDPQTYEQSKKETRACDGPSSSSLADNSIDPSADRQSQDTSDLPIQSLKEAIEKTGALNKKIYSSASKSRTSTI
ncbi:uncharacterized protein [Temnothorax nylanderi]|uniref:uncharacterized protein n=1 Tax=Temnothorax nylanderi TaxID=102681 RepID=UPI003A8AAFFC